MSHHHFHNVILCLLAVALSLFSMPDRAVADGQADRRAWVGLDLFPAVLAADNHIEDKKGEEGRLHLLLVHRGRGDLAGEMAEELARVGTIRGISLRISEVNVEDLGNAVDDTPAGIFLVERMGNELGTVIRFGEDRHVIVFSPFTGDVEAGVSSGLVVSDRILPYVNTTAMRLSGIQLKSFFLNVAEQYGE